MGQVEEEVYRPLVPAGERATRRQDLPPLYRLNGAISIYRTEALLARRPEVEEAHLWLARLLEQDGALEEALARYRALAEVRPTDQLPENTLATGDGMAIKTETGEITTQSARAPLVM